MNATLPILRARLELDQTLRTRMFFVRASRGELAPEEYRELVAQWGRLAVAAVPDATGLLDLAVRDVGPLDAAPRCPAIDLARTLAASGESELVSLAALALLGTSWTDDAADCGSRRGRSCLLLAELGQRSRAASHALQARLERNQVDPQVAYAFVEALRGVVLGVATYLDSTWPPPTTYWRFDLGGSV